jgi:hypothetical protein
VVGWLAVAKAMWAVAMLAQGPEQVLLQAAERVLPEVAVDQALFQLLAVVAGDQFAFEVPSAIREQRC